MNHVQLCDLHFKTEENVISSTATEIRIIYERPAPVKRLKDIDNNSWPFFMSLVSST